jgi:O-antigen ligase
VGVSGPLTANRDFGRLGNLVLLVVAVLAGAGVATFVAWEGGRHKRLELSLFGPEVPFLDGMPHLLTVLLCAVLLVVVGVLLVAARIGSADRIALGLFGFSLYADVVPYIFQLSMLMIVLVLVREGMRRGNVAFPLSPMFVPAGLVMLLFLSSVLKEPRFAASLNSFLFCATYIFLLVLLPGVLRTRRHLETLFDYMLIGALVSCTVIFIQLAMTFATGTPVSFDTGTSQKASTPWGIMPRLTGLMYHPNHLSNVLCSIGVMALWFATRAAGTISRGRRAFLLASYVYLGVGVLLTFSRSGWLSLGIMTMLVPVLRWPRVAPVYIGGLAGIGGLMYVTGAAQNIYEIVVGFNKSSAEFRWHIDLIAIQAFAREPWTGTGVGGVLNFFNSYGLPVHDMYLQVLAELGILGAVVIGGLALTLITRLMLVVFRARNPLDRDWASALLLAAGITAIQGQFAMFLWMKFIWALFALMECAIQVANRQRGDAEPADIAFMPLRAPAGRLA